MTVVSDLGRGLTPPLLGLAALWAATPLCAGRLLINETASVPRGLYARTGQDRVGIGDLVAVRQPPVALAYLAPLRVPATMPLLKRVAGVEGDEACRRGDRITVGSRSAPVMVEDRRKVVLPSWRDCRRLAADELFLLGDSLSSFDSRYFGPVRRRDVLGAYRVVLAW